MKQPARIDTRTSLEKLSGLLDAGRQQFGGLLGAIPVVGQMEAIDRGIRAAGQGNMTGVAEAAADIIPAGRLATRGIKALTKGKSTGLLGDVMNVNSPNASDIRVRQQDNEKIYERDGVRIGVWENSPWSPRPMSITDFVVDENMRGKGVGKKMLDDVLANYDLNQVSAAASSAPSAALFYKKGLRPASNPNATLDETLRQMKEDSSVTMVMPARDTTSDDDLLALQGSQSAINLPNFERLLGLLEDSQ